MRFERRYRLVWIDQNAILALFSNRDAKFYELPDIDDLPSDIEVISADFDMCRMAFAFVVFHPSFDIVPHGELIPDCGNRRIVLRRRQEFEIIERSP